MRNLIVSFLVAAGLAARTDAGPVTVGGLPPWEFADTEVSTNVPFAFPDENVRHLLLSLELAGTPSNCVVVAFGRDSDRNGSLDLREIGMEVGWNCGVWRIRRGIGNAGPWCGEERTASAATGERVKRLDLDLGVTRAKAKRLDASENGTPLAWTGGAGMPEGLYDSSWDTLKLTVRGVDAADESLRAQLRVEGALISIR